MVDENNPAGRYYALLMKAKGQGDNSKVRSVWAKVFDVDEKNDSLVISHVVALYSLGEEVKSLVNMISDVNAPLYLSSFPQIEKAIFPLNLDVSWQGPKKHLNDGAMTRLQFCSELLKNSYQEESIDSEELELIKKMIDDLFEATISSSVNDILRLTLLEEIERLRTALAMYRIKGAKGLKQSLQSTIGMVFANQSELKNEEHSNAEVLQKLGVLIDKIDAFTAKAMKVHKVLSKPVQFLIEHFSSEDSEDTFDQ
ncbi:hypothetical protein ACYVL9_002954 [Vibrio fluvialis]|uniref:Uncharacterized protein n=1 Tax=Vibrio porteresiae DSM 19223 TaxID=1123496 RepID=A0ABZ0QCG7_9VIBR|nr:MULTISPECIES: hypothetical protein [Vibrio]EIN5961898.1 hypothetical protein [Vibrio cholerae]MBY7869470.1 hypothetical protein [Vibrio fluvialis]HDU8574767.1 hypothetical protein [Vibrio parahaemolyticus]HDY7922654.1 hypothetical protein [Vibrio vulnificus]AVF75871.1 hypothetical protein AL539_20130 [Vibrio alginolyticus]